MSNGFLQDKTGDKSCKRLGGMLLIAGGLVLDTAIAFAVILGKDQALGLKGISTPMYLSGGAMITGGVLESKYMNK